jgi:hypothetical protein
MFEDSSWIDAVHSCSYAGGYWWSATADAEVFNAESLVSYLGFSTGGHPLRRLLAVLSRLNSTKMVREFGMVGDYDLEPVHSVNDYTLEALLHVPNVKDVVERELTSVGRDFYQMMVPRLVASETSGFDASSILFTDISMAGWVPILVDIILVVPSPALVLGNQVDKKLKTSKIAKNLVKDTVSKKKVISIDLNGQKSVRVN